MLFNKALVSSLLVVAAAAYGNFTSTVVKSEDVATTILTITSCSENKCSSVPVTTGVTVVTSTVEGTVTEYTTYCPLTAHEATSSVEIFSSAINSTVPTTLSNSYSNPVAASTAVPSTVAPVSSNSTSAAVPVSSNSTSTNPDVSTLEGSGNKLAVGAAALAGFAGIFLL